MAYGIKELHRKYNQRQHEETLEEASESNIPQNTIPAENKELKEKRNVVMQRLARVLVAYGAEDLLPTAVKLVMDSDFVNQIYPLLTSVNQNNLNKPLYGIVLEAKRTYDELDQKQ
jgi:hypothetical protein